MPVERLGSGRVARGGVLVAGDHPAERRRMLARLRIGGETRPLAVGLDARLAGRVAALGPAVVLYYVGPRPDAKVFDTITALSALAKLVVIADADDDALAVRALKAGARGYCLRGTPARLLRKAIRLVEDGEIWVGRRVMQRLIEELARRADGATPHPDAVARLTERERAITRMIGRGAGNKDIAAAMAISVKTVKTHLTNIFKKLGVSSRLQLALALGPETDPGPRS
jgi:DNA-binding NarL/FixJ family response regulator